MPTRQPDSTHEAENIQPLPPKDPRGNVESPSADRLQGANGLPHDPEPEPSGDQDIDTAGTEADEP